MGIFSRLNRDDKRLTEEVLGLAAFVAIAVIGLVLIVFFAVSN